MIMTQLVDTPHLKGNDYDSIGGHHPTSKEMIMAQLMDTPHFKGNDHDSIGGHTQLERK
jgi:allantoicase